MLLERWRPGDKGDAQAIVDQGEPTRRQREALTIGAGDFCRSLPKFSDEQQTISGRPW
jgi:hypothetical protein